MLPEDIRRIHKKKRLLPIPNSKFLRIKCKKCGNVQITFSHASIKVYCRVCNELLAEPTGGKAKILGEIVEELE